MPPKPRVDKEGRETERRRLYEKIPKKDWVELSGRKRQILDEQAARYGMPVTGRTVDLGAFLTWFHDWLAKNARKLTEADSEELCRSEKAKLLRLDRMEREGSLILREEAHQYFARLAGVLHNLGEVLQREFGPRPLRLLNQAIGDFDREADSLFADATQPNSENDAG